MKEICKHLGVSDDTVYKWINSYDMPAHRLGRLWKFKKDELVVLSFPGPDRSIRIQDIAAGKAVSRRYRNRRIGEFFKELDLTEGRSTGIAKIMRAIQRNGSPTPIFETDEGHSYFLLHLPLCRPDLLCKKRTEHPPRHAPGTARL